MGIPPYSDPLDPLNQTYSLFNILREQPIEIPSALEKKVLEEPITKNPSLIKRLYNFILRKLY